MATERLDVTLSLKAQQYKREARDAASATGKISGQAQQAGKATGGLQTKMGGLGSVMRSAAVVGGIAAVGRGLFSAVEAAERSASAMAITEQVIKETGGAANVTGEDVAELSRRLSALTGVEDELVQEGANVLLTFKNISNEVGAGNDIFDRTAELMLDVSSIMNTDAKGAAIQLGKALNDPVANMGALSRSGLTFTAQQKDQIKTLAESGQLLEAQKIILSELESQLGGTAAASADASDKISNAFGEIAEAVGMGVLPFLEGAAAELQVIVGLTDELDRVSTLTGGAAESAESLLTVLTEETGGAGFISGAGTALQEFFTFLAPGISRTEQLRDTMEELAERLDPPELRRAIDGLQLMGEEMGLTSSEIEIVSEVLEDQLVQAADEAAESVEGVGRASGSSAGEVGDLADSAGDAARSFGDIVTSMESYETMLRRLTDPVFKAIDDQQRLEEATQKYLDVIDDPESTIGDQERAMLDLVQAQIAAEESAAGLPDDMKAATDSIILLGDRAGITHEDLGRLRDLIEEFDGLSAQATIGINVVGGERIEGIDINKNVVLRQHGGRLRADQPAIIGEDGPEVWIPDRSGMIVSNADATDGGATLQGNPAGSTVNVFTLTWGDFVRKAADAGLEIQRYGW